MGKLIRNGYEYGGAIVDTALDTTSENPVQNKVVANAINTINTHLIKNKSMVYPSAITIDGKQATYPWQVLSFEGVLNTGETLVMCNVRRINSNPDGLTFICNYNQANNQITVSVTNEFVNSQTLDANTIVLDILYL
jgi:hypothetical protein